MFHPRAVTLGSVRERVLSHGYHEFMQNFVSDHTQTEHRGHTYIVDPKYEARANMKRYVSIYIGFKCSQERVRCKNEEMDGNTRHAIHGTPGSMSQFRSGARLGGMFLKLIVVH